ncbi:PLD nuclease N-terminal domain-containing protein [Nocardioides sp. HM23]|uniref:PLD nuclease N-terminal domain-containing protein n=1 Tax=Nocardioides bizhenqiangii TaxID=3095076 RepID=UPI002ACA8968|nr:PLD nuclease N-terminal domain-containing protein [Nocardioides sp. HM23]MDZ5623025.1 PLD nuclease N-terminal domain-containing protein [Nocardioides sp. HM23]
MEDGFGLWEVIVSTFSFMLLMSWIYLFVFIVGDILRDGSLRGASKALWIFCIVVLPWLGAVIYLLARGDSLPDRTQQAAIDRHATMRSQAGEP